ncbi:MAG TPA: 4-hydroxy-tetrahydrodipicolinate synthase [Cyclobacteriaceae bacterium]|nr:4-hydroxy-tetrahydrodipicolinate synthase [Cyclobacteriaceae bacterium]
MKKLHGTGVALITPFTSTLDVDYAALKKLIKHSGKGVDYYVVMGTTGESPTVSGEEKKKILEFVKKNNSRNLPIVYGIGGNNTQHVIDEIKSTDLSGVDALLSVSPYYSKPSQEGIYQHFKAVAKASPIPVMLYNIPGRTGSNISAETTLRLAAIKNIIGTKEASGNLEQCMKIAKDMPEDFILTSGDDMLALAIYSIGGKGVISVLANAYPQVFKKMKDYAFAGNYAKAKLEQFKLLDINGLMYEEGNPIGIKQVLSYMNICGPHVRLPHISASEGLQKKIKALYQKV